MDTTQRGSWGSSVGFILAAAGSAVGVGNLWKFPYITWDNQGGTFVFVYLFSVILIGFPLIVSELFLGKSSQLSGVSAILKLSKGLGKKIWPLGGWLGVAASTLILSYVTVIGCWAIAYFFFSVQWSISGYESQAIVFGEFLENSSSQIFITLFFSLMTGYVVWSGIGNGIEKANKILMPSLFIILLILLIYSTSLKGFSQSISFLFTPDFSKINGQLILAGMGQAFFSLSLGMAIMITYGSYLSKNDSITRSGAWVLFMDTMVAIVASIIMFSIIFSFPSLKDQISGSTTGMLFTTLPELFYNSMTGGAFLGPIFFILLIFATLSSTVSLLEVPVALFIDKYNFTRKKATIVATLIIFMISVLVILSLNPSNSLSNFKLFGHAENGIFYRLNLIFTGNKSGFMNVIDHLTSNWILPTSGLLICLMVGWSVKKDDFFKIVERNASYLLFLIKYIAPIGIGYVILKIINGADFT